MILPLLSQCLKDEFRADIGNYANKLPYYVELKKRWKVSIAAMIRRSYSLGLIGNDEYQKMMRNMQKQGIRKVEPLDDTLVTAKPSLLKQGCWEFYSSRRCIYADGIIG